MGGVATEEKYIIRAQYLDLVYSQSDTLYDMIPHAPRPLNDPTRTALEPGYVSNTKTTSNPAHTLEINAVQSTSSHKLGGKNKNKGKSKKFSNQEDTTKTVDTQLNRKAKFPYMICTEDHYMKYFPPREEVNNFLKCTSLPAVLTDPFPI